MSYFVSRNGPFHCEHQFILQKNAAMIKLFVFAISISFYWACKSASTQGSESSSKGPVLASWNDGDNKKAIIDFVNRTTKQGSADFIPVGDRIACFDNDGTLWGEQPAYYQLFFAIDRVKVMAPLHPEWNTKEPFASILKDDMKGFMASGEKGIFEVIMETHAGITTDEFDNAVRDWLAKSKHPKTGKPYNQMTYKPMVELLDYLRANGYKTFIVSGGGVDFMRVWTEVAYGIPRYQVVGSSGKTKYEVKDGVPVLIKLPEVNFIDDKDGKPVGIHQYIGKRPVFTAGNSDGDFAMLQYTTTGTGYPRLGMIVHHTDSLREYAYDRHSHIGTLNMGLDSAAKYHIRIIDMKNDWKTIYSFQ